MSYKLGSKNIISRVTFSFTTDSNMDLCIHQRVYKKKMPKVTWNIEQYIHETSEQS